MIERSGEEKKEKGEDEDTAELIYRKKVIEPPFLIRKFGVSEEEEYDQLTDEDTKADLFDGTLIIHSPASIRHECIFMFMAFLMHGYVEQRQLGKVLGSRATMHLAHCRKFEPDILFLRKERLELLKEKELEGAVDMVVEILSEWTQDYDLREKGRYIKRHTPQRQQLRVGSRAMRCKASLCRRSGSGKRFYLTLSFVARDFNQIAAIYIFFYSTTSNTGHV